MQSNEQVWKPVVGYEGLYEVSSTGMIRSVDRIVKHKNTGHLTCKAKYITAKVNSWGYMSVKLSKEGRTRTLLVHRLVALTFIPNPEKKKFVNHKNGNKLCNCAWNLEWVSHSQNIKHAHELGLITYKSKPVIDTKTGKVFADIKKAAAHFNLSYSTLKNYLNENRYNPTTLKYHRKSTKGRFSG